MPGSKNKPKKKDLNIIRVRSEFHQIAKVAACEKFLTLQAWIEQLIVKEANKEVN